MWMIDLIGYLFGAIIALILFAIMLGLTGLIVFVIGCGIEYVQGKENGFFHKIANKLDR